MSGSEDGDSDKLKEAAEALAAASVAVGTHLTTHPAPTEYKPKKFLGIKYGQTLIPEDPEPARNRLDLEILIEEIDDVEGRLWSVQRRIEKAKLVEKAVDDMEDAGTSK